MSNFVVYALLDPETGACRYVGQTKQSPSERLRQHLRDSFNNKKSAFRTHLGCWVRSVVAKNKQPNQVILTITNQAHVDSAEVYWIYYFNAIGCKLTNHDSGGNKNKTLSTATKNKISKSRTKTRCLCGAEYTLRKTYKTCVPCQQKYYIENKAIILEKKRQHRLLNIEKYKEKDRNYYLKLNK